jgi:hypothetical protein
MKFLGSLIRVEQVGSCKAVNAVYDKFHGFIEFVQSFAPNESALNSIHIPHERRVFERY